MNNDHLPPLTFSTEPIQQINDASVHRLLTADPHAYLGYLRNQLQGIANGDLEVDLPFKQLFVDPGDHGDFRVMPCVVRGWDTVRKTVKIVGTNLAQNIVPNQVTVGKAFILHPDENFISYSFDANALSSARTGACIVLALELLASRKSTISLIGAGRVGYYTAYYLGALEGIERIFVADLDPSRASALIHALRQAHPHIDWIPGDAAPETDVLICATTSTTPVVDCAGSNIPLIISAGADTNWQHELTAACAADADIYVDTLDSLNYGDLAQWGQEQTGEPGLYNGPAGSFPE